ncbi:MAG: hypothetical protein ACREJO_03560 [Phycisphaerales bacterium]
MSAFPLSMGPRLRHEWPTVSPWTLEAPPKPTGWCGVCAAALAGTAAEAAAQAQGAVEPIDEFYLLAACYRSERLRGHVLRCGFAPGAVTSPLYRRVLACLLTGRVMEVSGAKLCGACWWELGGVLAGAHLVSESTCRDWARAWIRRTAAAGGADAFRWAVDRCAEGVDPFTALAGVAQALGVTRRDDPVAGGMRWAWLEAMAEATVEVAA